MHKHKDSNVQIFYRRFIASIVYLAQKDIQSFYSKCVRAIPLKSVEGKDMPLLEQGVKKIPSRGLEKYTWGLEKSYRGVELSKKVQWGNFGQKRYRGGYGWG